MFGSGSAGIIGRELELISGAIASLHNSINNMSGTPKELGRIQDSLLRLQDKIDRLRNIDDHIHEEIVRLMKET